MRTFQFSDAKSHKFWQIEVSGSAFTVSFGKVGTAGQTQTKTFPTPQAAQAAADKLIQEKTGKGYKETTPTASTSASSDAAALERGIVEHRDEFVRWAVYSDYLTEQGDPRGEFMRVQLDLEDGTLSAADRKKLKKREVQILAEHERAWLGPLAAFTVDAEPVDVWFRDAGTTKRPPVVHRFERGWLASLDFGSLSVNQARAYAACPDARLVRELIVHNTAYEAPEGENAQYADSVFTPGPDTPPESSEPSFAALCRCPHLGAVRSLRIGERVDVTDDGGHFNSGITGEYALPLARQMPFLEELEVYAREIGMSALFALPLPHLRSVTLFHANTIYPLEKLAANKTLANLATIRCHPHTLEYDDFENGAYIGLKQLKAICRSPHLTSLTHLCLRLTDFGDKGAEEIVKSGILKRLKVLDLYGGCMSDEGAKLLAACPDFKNLEFANLRKNALTADGIKALKATKVNLDVRHQHTDIEWDRTGDEPPEYLYDGDGE